MHNEPGRRREILLAENDPLDVELTLSVLEAQPLGGKVIVVSDGAEVLEYLLRQGKYAGRRKGNPVVILLDNKMPKISGLEVLKIIRANEHLKLIPVVALTSSREPSDLKAFYQHGVNAYVVKPLMFSAFADAVRQVSLFWASINEPPLAE